MPDVLISILRQAQDDRGKALSNLLLAFCGGLFAAGAAHAWEIGSLDGTFAIWFLAGLACGFVAWRVLGFLETEGAA
jgi:hypothetical protein